MTIVGWLSALLLLLPLLLSAVGTCAWYVVHLWRSAPRLESALRTGTHMASGLAVALVSYFDPSTLRLGGALGRPLAFQWATPSVELALVASLALLTNDLLSRGQPSEDRSWGGNGLIYTFLLGVLSAGDGFTLALVWCLMVLSVLAIETWISEDPFAQGLGLGRILELVSCLLLSTSVLFWSPGQVGLTVQGEYGPLARRLVLAAGFVWLLAPVFKSRENNDGLVERWLPSLAAGGYLILRALLIVDVPLIQGTFLLGNLLFVASAALAWRDRDTARAFAWRGLGVIALGATACSLSLVGGRGLMRQAAIVAIALLGINTVQTPAEHLCRLRRPWNLLLQGLLWVAGLVPLFVLAWLIMAASLATGRRLAAFLQSLGLLLHCVPALAELVERRRSEADVPSPANGWRRLMVAIFWGALLLLLMVWPALLERLAGPLLGGEAITYTFWANREGLAIRLVALVMVGPMIGAWILLRLTELASIGRWRTFVWGSQNNRRVVFARALDRSCDEARAWLGGQVIGFAERYWLIWIVGWMIWIMYVWAYR